MATRIAPAKGAVFQSWAPPTSSCRLRSSPSSGTAGRSRVRAMTGTRRLRRRRTLAAVTRHSLRIVEHSARNPTTKGPQGECPREPFDRQRRARSGCPGRRGRGLVVTAWPPRRSWRGQQPVGDGAPIRLRARLVAMEPAVGSRGLLLERIGPFTASRRPPVTRHTGHRRPLSRAGRHPSAARMSRSAIPHPRPARSR